MVTTLRFLDDRQMSKLKIPVPVSTSITAYYVISRKLAQELVKTDVFYSSDSSDENQISFILQDKSPDIIRRRSQSGSIKFSPTPKELENDLKAVFGKHGGPMPVYRFVCDQSEGGIMQQKSSDGIRQIMIGLWEGKGIKSGRKISVKDMVKRIPAKGSGKLDTDIPDGIKPEKCIVLDNKEGCRSGRQIKDLETAVYAAFPSLRDRAAVDIFDN